jgi:hypothetical protein
MSQEDPPRRRGPQSQPYREQHIELQLLSARAAAIRLGVNPRTAQKRAQRAMVAGAPEVQTIAGAYCAPEAWWVKLLTERPIRPGRPLLDDFPGWELPQECLIGVLGDPELEARERELTNARRRWRYHQKRVAVRAAAAPAVGDS